MTACLLTRRSPAQIYCANTLFRRGAIDLVVLEEGSSIEPSGRERLGTLWRLGPAGIVKRAARDVAFFDGNPFTCLDYYRTRLATRGLMNRRVHHEARILTLLGRRFDDGLPVVRVRSVNDPAAQALIRSRGYRLVFVFGTGLLKPPMLTQTDATFVNLHWGLVPRYRGEGIVSALAEEGVQGLGVTVHVIDEGLDSGPVLYQERLIPEPGDNVYAIGLKLTVLGVQGLLRVHEAFHGAGLHPIPQDASRSRTYRWRDLKTNYRRLRLAQHALAAMSQTHEAWRDGADA